MNVGRQQPGPSWELRWLGFHARVQAPADVLARLAATRPRPPAWADSAPGDGGVHFTVRRGGEILRDGVRVAVADRRRELLPLLDRALTAAAVEDLGQRWLLLHAGAVVWRGRALLLPAASGSGKSTLIAGLLAAGCGYLSDEVAVLDAATGCLLPFPTSLGLKAGARRVLAPLFPEVARLRRQRIDGHAVWPFRPPEAAWPGGPARPGYIVLPRYTAGAPPTLEPVARATALAECVAQSYRLRAQGAAGLRGLVELVQASKCFSLTGGDLGGCVDLLRRLLETAN